MARTVNQEEYAAKRGEILDTALALIFAKGYERVTIQDILSELGMSSGAFYHYFGSKPAVLDALIERIKVETEKPLLPVIHDPHLTAIEKLQGFFDTFDRLRTAQKAYITSLGRVWYTDDNAIVRQKVDAAIFEQRAPLLAEIVRQGVREGVFTSANPDRTGEVIMSLLQGMGNTHARLMLSVGPETDDQRLAEEIVAVHVAYMDALERVLGAPPNCLYRADAESVMAVWVAAVRDSGQA